MKNLQTDEETKISIDKDIEVLKSDELHEVEFQVIKNFKNQRKFEDIADKMMLGDDIADSEKENGTY